MNLNIGCIETQNKSWCFVYGARMNLNIGCIETLILIHLLPFVLVMNLNIGCIETRIGQTREVQIIDDEPQHWMY